MLGTREVAWPIITSTLTTLAAFGPLLLWDSIMGEFMGYLPLTLIICLTSSLFVALVINPAVCAAFMRVKPGHKWGSQGRELGLFLRGYRGIITTAVRWKYTTALVSFAIFFGIIAIYVLSGLGAEFFPKTDPPRASVDITFPEGTLLKTTKKLAISLEEEIQGLPGAQDVDSITTTVGSRGVSQLFSTGGTAPNIARLSLEFKDMDERQGSTTAFVENIRHRFSRVAGADLRVRKEEMGPPGGDPVNVEIHGDDYKLLGELAAKAKKIIRDVAGVVDIRDDFEPGRPELEIIVDRKRAALLGLSPLEAGMTLQTAYRGTKIGVLRLGDEEYDVNIIATEKDRQGFAMLDKLFLTTQTGRLVPASSVADWRIRGGQGSIKKIDRDLVVSVSSDVSPGFQAESVREAVNSALADFKAKLPPGYFVTLTGEQEMMGDAKTFLTKAFIIAIFLIALILISQFNSIRLPIIILSSVLLSFIGVFFGLLVLGKPFIIMMTGIGVISLAGVVVNNAIVLVDYITKLRERGLTPFEAIIEAGLTRLRPVLLTAITTIFGLIPMAVGLSFDFHRGTFASGKEMAQFWSPMAWAVIFGLAVATILTLVVLPTLYAVLMGVRPRTSPEPQGEGEGEDPDDGEPHDPTPPPQDDFHEHDPFAGLVGGEEG
jgi:multidrug efflux pump subunit AcrB